MRTRTLLTLASCLALGAPVLRAADAPAAPAKPKITYQDHILPILRNTCLNCHNPDKKKGNLDLSTYSGAVTGGGSGKAFEPGDPDNSMIYKVISWSIEPNMPPKGDKIPEKDINLIREWIAGGAPETSGSKVAINKPKSNLAVVVTTGKPEGPVAMPKDLSLDPVVVARHPAALTALAASPWAPVVAVGGQRQVVLYNSDTLDLLGVLPFPEGLPYSLKFSRNGSVLLAGGGVGAKSGKVVAYDVTTGKRVAEVGDEFDAILTADVSPDQSQVAIGTPLKTLKILNTADGSTEQTIKKHTDWVQAAAYSPDGRFLASGDRAGGLWVWEAKTARELYNCAGHKEGVTDACFRGDSNILASASTDGTIKLWNMTDGTLAKTINAHPGGVLAVSFTHDGRMVSCGRDGQVKLWGPDGAALKTFERFNDIALRAVFDYDGQRVIAGDFTGAIRVFGVADGKRIGELTANPLSVAQQLAGFDQRLKDLQAAADKAAAELKAAQSAHDQATQQRTAATAARGAAAELIEKLQGRVAFLTKEATTQAQSAKDSLASRKSAADAAVTARDQAKSALATATADLQKAKAAVAAARTAADEAFAAAQKAREKSAASPDDVAFASAARERTEAAAKTAAEVESRLKAVAPQSAQVQAMSDKLAKAEADAKSTAAAYAEAQSASRTTADNSPQIAAAKQALAKARVDLDAATKALESATKGTKSADDRLAKAQSDAKAATQSVEAAKAQRTRLEAIVNKQPAKTARS
jgi:WD40 repeat protein